MPDDTDHSMKVLGGRYLPDHWERFDRLQRTMHKLRGGSGPAKGVYRFKTFEEFNEWKRLQALKHQPLGRGQAPEDERT
jgi:hypothetical protein